MSEELKKPIDRLGILISGISLLLAVPITVFFGVYVVMGTLLGVVMFFRTPSVESVEVFLYCFGCLLGICGLWLRAVVQLFASKPSRLVMLVATLLIIGGVAALGVVMVDIRGNMNPITKNLALSGLGKVMIGLGLIAIAIGLHNIFINQSLKKNALKVTP